MKSTANAAEAAASQEQQSLSELCLRLALEMETQRQVCMRVERSLCTAADCWGLDDERVRDLQQLDSLMQHLAALRDFLTTLSHAAETGIRVDPAMALERILLGDLKARLRGGGANDTEASPTGGELEWL